MQFDYLEIRRYLIDIKFKAFEFRINSDVFISPSSHIRIYNVNLKAPFQDLIEAP
jgi:hypothetical protein